MAGVCAQSHIPKIIPGEKMAGKDIFIVLGSPKFLNDIPGIPQHFLNFIWLWRSIQFLVNLHFGLVLKQRNKQKTVQDYVTRENSFISKYALL